MPANKPNNKRGRPPKLTLEHVMQQALIIADTQGINALTIRGIARACNVTPMAIYLHVDTVADLEELAFRQAMQQMQPPSQSGPWREQVISIWRNFRDMLMAHPGAAAVFAKRQMPTPEIINATRQLLEVLETAGLTPDQAFAAYDATFIFTLGSVRFDISRTPDARTGILDNGHPMLQRYAANLSQRDPDAAFETGMEIILRGF